MRWWVLALAVLLGCGGGDDGPADGTSGTDTEGEGGDAALDTTPAPVTECNLGLGESCFEDEQCESGLCLISEYAPFGICTRECDNAPDFCFDDAGDPIAGTWCVAYPKGVFQIWNHTEVTDFCVRTCTDEDSCQAIDPAYEECDDLKYQGNPLFPSDPMPVCQAPSATGKTPVDPFTCADWEAANPGYGNEKNLCKNYCSYLRDCQYYDLDHNMDCCSWYCFLQLVDDKGNTNGPYEDVLTNYWLFYKANEGNAQECNGEEQYGIPALPDANAPEAVAGTCTP